MGLVSHYFSHHWNDPINVQHGHWPMSGTSRRGWEAYASIKVEAGDVSGATGSGTPFSSYQEHLSSLKTWWADKMNLRNGCIRHLYFQVHDISWFNYTTESDGLCVCLRTQVLLKIHFQLDINKGLLDVHYWCSLNTESQFIFVWCIWNSHQFDYSWEF